MTIIQFPGSSIDISEVHERFATAMRQRDLIPPSELLADGKIHRCDVRGKRGKNDGSYILFLTGKIPAGGFLNFKDGLGWQNWHHDLGRSTLTPAEQRELEAKRAAAARDRAEQEKVDAATAADRAQYIWSRAKEPAAHEYLTRKNVGACGTRIKQTALVVPARTVDGELRGLQFIGSDGKKLWMTGSRPSGAFHQIGDCLAGDVVVCEGFATGASIHAATGKTTLVAFSCGNLRPVAEALKSKHPHSKIIIAADDDRDTKGNPGIHAAMDAALAVDGLIVGPNFDGNLSSSLTDFNDLADPNAIGEAFKSACNAFEFLERRLLADPFTAFDAENIKAVVKLKERNRGAFERLRDRLKQTGARTAELDKLWGETESSDGVTPGEKAALKQADILVKLTDAAQLFHARDGTAYADIKVGDHRETCAIYSRDFKRWLKHRYYEQTESSPGSEAFNSALGTIEAKAIYEGPEREVYLRSGSHAGNIYIDIGDEQWRAIEVTAAGWGIVSEPPIRFRRPGTMLPLPLPVPGGKIWDLRPFINVPNDDAFILAVAFMLSALRPEGPYPVLSLHGSAGTAKSTFSEVMRRLVDPGKPALRSLPREKEDFFIAANNNHLLAFENISFIPTWISDLMCQLSTGGGHSRREPYTAMDETTFDAQKPQVLNGIEDFVIRGDLADRAVPLVLQTIEESKWHHERAFWLEFTAAAPRILGVLLDALANGLRHLPTTELKVLPRMADFAIWATACETGSSWVTGRTFAQAYSENRAEATAIVLEDDTVAQALRKFMAGREFWKGRAAELLAELTAGWNGDVPDKWPKAGNKLSNRLRRVMPQLAAVGIRVTIGKTSDRSHHAVIAIEKIGPSDDDRPRIGATQVAPPLSSETLRPSEVVQTQDDSFSEISSDGASDVSSAPSDDVSEDEIPRSMGQKVSSDNKPNGNKASEHRRISEDTGGGIEIGPEKKKTLRNCMKCGSATGEVLTRHVAGADVDLHQTCVPFWLRDPTPHPSLLEIPEFLDRRRSGLSLAPDAVTTPSFGPHDLD